MALGRWCTEARAGAIQARAGSDTARSGTTAHGVELHFAGSSVNVQTERAEEPGCLHVILESKRCGGIDSQFIGSLHQELEQQNQRALLPNGKGVAESAELHPSSNSEHHAVSGQGSPDVEHPISYAQLDFATLLMDNPGARPAGSAENAGASAAGGSPEVATRRAIFRPRVRQSDHVGAALQVPSKPVQRGGGPALLGAFRIG